MFHRWQISKDLIKIDQCPQCGGTFLFSHPGLYRRIQQSDEEHSFRVR
ncbi:MAG: zf-TFIIB domain-containing protein [Anaerolineales bacterium]|nr:zf-TFIIB domain-containing protein [Anaerolineales bacterium]